MRCPACGAFSGKRLADTLERHAQPRTTASKRKKKDFKIKRKPVQMYLLIHTNWLKGERGFQDDKELGGYAGAPVEDTVKWYKKRLNTLLLIEVRGKKLPEEINLPDGTLINSSRGTIPKRAHFTCSSCGRENNTLEAVRTTKHTAPVAAYTYQCHCPQCEAEGYNYGGRYFKTVDNADVNKLAESEFEWEKRSCKDLHEYWPKQICWDAYMMRANGGVNDGWGYTHWWKMFNSRQLLVHTQLIKAITEADENSWALDIKESILGALQQFIRNQNMFSFWDISRDCMAPALSNSNFHPKSLVIENCVFNKLGRGNWSSNTANTIVGVEWANNPWESVILPATEKAKSSRERLDDPVIPGNEPYCASSTDLNMIGEEKFDLVITDPPFGDNLFYADLADFFYVWLRIPLQKWYEGLPEQKYFDSERTPHSMEAIDNSVEHPDDREDFEKTAFIEGKYIEKIRELSGDNTLEEKEPNPFYRPIPSSDFYSQTLSACWGGIRSSSKRRRHHGIHFSSQ